MATATIAVAGRAAGSGYRYLADAQVKANSPYGLPIIEDVRQFELGSDSFFSGLSQSSLEELNRIKHTSSYPEGAIVLMEGQAARGVYIVCQGRVKLMTTNSEGKTLIVKIAQPGEVLGLQSVVTGNPYELTVETLQPSQLAYIRMRSILAVLEDALGCVPAGDAALEPGLPVGIRSDPLDWIVPLSTRQACSLVAAVVGGQQEHGRRGADEDGAHA